MDAILYHRMLLVIPRAAFILPAAIFMNNKQWHTFMITVLQMKKLRFKQFQKLSQVCK